MRKCSLCRSPGHTKRTCDQKQNSKKIPATKPPVVVRVVPEIDKSPHVVNLKKEVLEDPFIKVEVYEESSVKNIAVNQVVDLAKAVKSANNKKMQEWKEKMVAVEKGLFKHKEKIVKKPLAKAGSPLSKFFYKTDSAVAIKPLPQKTRPKIKISKPQVNIFSRKRLAYATLSLAVILALPFPAIGYVQHLQDVNGVVVAESTNAFLALQSSTVAALKSNLPQAETDLTKALQSFATANSLVEKEYHLLTSVASFLPIIGNQVTSRQELLVAGQHLALGNTYLVKGIKETREAEESPITERFSILQRHLKSSIPQYNEALSSLNQVDPKAIPSKYQQSFADFKILFGAFINDMKDLTDLMAVFNTIFGDDSFKRYLVIFQNNHELRPTGGFMGSFAILDVQKGKILNIEVPGGGTYDIKGQLTEYVKPPLPLQLLNKRWEFQDSNWFPDFAASASKMEWFYENSRGSTVDGVISINANLLEDFLAVVGPLETGEGALDENNALQNLQEEVELNYDKEKNKPKEIIGELLDESINIVKDSDKLDIVRLLSLLHKAAEKKDIQIFINETEVQDELRSFGWTGEIFPTHKNQDYLMVVHSNIQGQKSDAKIKQEIEHQTNVLEDGSIVNNVTIRRTHTGTPGEQFYGSQNISYVRVYTPEGSELLSADGFVFPPEDAFKVPEAWYQEDPHLETLEEELSIDEESGTRITKEFGKTAFGNWVITQPGETSEISFSYKLPFVLNLQEIPLENTQKWKSLILPDTQDVTSRYSFVLQKQSGLDSDIKISIKYPEEWSPVWKSKEEIDLSLNGAEYDTVLDRDLIVGLVMKKQNY